MPSPSPIPFGAQVRKPVIAEDDGVREIHGVEFVNTDTRVQLFEDGTHILLYRCSYDRHLTPRQARYIARKLHRLARRIDRREVGQ